MLQTDADDGIEGHGFTFTIGRGNEVVRGGGARRSHRSSSGDAGAIAGDMGAFWREITGDSQLRWIGPEKGVIHLATAAVVNAVWDLWAKARGQAALEAARGHDARASSCGCVDFRYITDAITPDEAVALLRRRADQARARGGDAPRRLSRLHDVGGLARLRRRQDPPRSAGRRSRRD